MKKTTSAFMAALLSTTVLGAGMLLIGSSPAALSIPVSASTTRSSTTIQIQQNVNVASQSIPSRSPILRTSGS